MNPNKQHPKQSPQPHSIPSSTPLSSNQPHQSTSTSTFHTQSTPNSTSRQQSSCPQNIPTNIENQNNKQLNTSKFMRKQQGRMMIEEIMDKNIDSGKNQGKNVVFRGNSIENRYVKKGVFYQQLFQASVWDLGNRQFVDMNVAEVFVMLEECGAIVLMLDYNKYSNIIQIISNTKFTNLTNLYLGDNTITTIQPLPQCYFPNLLQLHLNDNPITKMTSFRKCNFPHLQSLSLKNTKIYSQSYIQDIIQVNCKSLHSLFLSYRNQNVLEKGGAWIWRGNWKVGRLRGRGVKGGVVFGQGWVAGQGAGVEAYGGFMTTVQVYHAASQTQIKIQNQNQNHSIAHSKGHQNKQTDKNQIANKNLPNEVQPDKLCAPTLPSNPKSTSSEKPTTTHSLPNQQHHHHSNATSHQSVHHPPTHVNPSLHQPTNPTNTENTHQINMNSAPIGSQSIGTRSRSGVTPSHDMVQQSQAKVESKVQKSGKTRNKSGGTNKPNKNKQD